MVFQRLKTWISNLKNHFKKKYYCWLAVGFVFMFVALPILTAAESGQNFFYVESSHIEIDDKLIELYNQSLYSLGILAPLYSKLKETAILGNDSRDSIYNLISTSPGITFGAITKELNLKTGTVSHHLRILEREGYIKSKKAGKFRRYYVVGTKATGFNQIQDRIVEKVQEQPGISQSDIGRELQLSRQLVNYHMKELVSQDVIKLEKIGNRCVCFSQPLNREFH